METLQALIDATALGSIYGLMAVGIGLVFGVLRLVNFAYGQLIMAGAYTLALATEHDLNPAASIALCFAVVIGLSLAMDLVVFRPLRNGSPATMLVTTFAVAFLLQSIALLWFGVLGKSVGTLTGLNRPIGGGELIVRWISIVDIVVAVVALGLLAVLLNRTSIGLHMRAAATDFRTARLLGVRANRVIAFAVLLSGVLAATVSVLLTVAQGYVTYDYALRDTIIVLVGVVVGGIDRLLSAMLGGFAIGFAITFINYLLGEWGSDDASKAWPFTHTVYIDSAVYALVIIVLLLRPAGLFARRGQGAAERV